MKPLRDRNGEPFTGTPEELKRHNNKLTKRAARAKSRQFSMDLPVGLAQQLDRVANAAGCSPQELISTHIGLLDELLASGDSQTFKRFTERTVTVSGLEKYFHRLGAAPAEGDEFNENEELDENDYT